MSEQTQAAREHPTLSNTDLAFERTMLAYERTLMAWVRTAVSLISFGFTIYKFFQEWRKTEPVVQSLFTPRIVGMIMIMFGLIGLLFAEIQHVQAINKLKRDYPKAQRSLTSVLAILILMFGLALFLAALFRQ